MKRFFLVFAFLCGASHAGVLTSFKITASGGAPIPTAYSISDTQSQVVTSLSRFAKTLCVFNGTASVVAVNIDASATVAPTADVKDIYVPANSGVCRSTDFLSTVYLRSDSGSTITSGKVYGDILTGVRIQ